MSKMKQCFCTTTHENGPSAAACGRENTAESWHGSLAATACCLILRALVSTSQVPIERTERPVTFDNADSFIVEIDTVEVAITPPSLSALMNSYVFAYPGAPSKNVQVILTSTQLLQKGALRKA
jgi:hypothetical protein